VSANKPHISQLRKYLNGELDAKAMYRLEREAQNDPFLMDALEGYEASGADKLDDLTELQQRLTDRISPKKERSILLWRVLPVAASLFIALTIGYMLFKPTSDKQKAAMPLVSSSTPPAPADKVSVQPDSAKKSVSAKPVLAQNNVPVHHHLNRPQPVISAPENVVASLSSIKEDTVAYTASNYAFYKKSNANTAEELLKKVSGIAVDANGNITSNGQQITRTRINGKDYAGDPAQAVKSLPADVVKDIQVIDAYGDQEAKARDNKAAGTDKILSIQTDTSKMFGNALAGRVNGINIGSSARINIRGAAPVKSETLNATVLRDSAAKTGLKAKTEKTDIDSTMYLAEVVVPGFADKAKSPVRPANGWKNYLAYIKHEAVMPDNSIGKVMLAFKVGKDGLLYGIRILEGSTSSINQKAIEILKNGPKWISGNTHKEVKLKIKFHKGS